MVLKKAKDGFYVLEKFSQIPNVLHGFSTVDFGNMSFVYGKKSVVLKNRAKFARAVGIDPKRLISVRQEHGKKIITITPGSSIKRTEKIVADGLITNQKNVALLIKTADCLPILLFGPINKTIGLIHAGRKGISLGIHLEAISNMRDSLGCNPEELLVGIGPAICSRCYHGKIDLLSVVLKDFCRAGIKKENIEVAGVCTFENQDFYSHQRSKITGEPEGRSAALLSWS